MKPNDFDEWVEITREWINEQMAEQRARDEAAWLKFRAGLDSIIGDSK